MYMYFHFRTDVLWFKRLWWTLKHLRDLPLTLGRANQIKICPKHHLPDSSAWRGKEASLSMATGLPAVLDNEQTVVMQWWLF